MTETPFRETGQTAFSEHAAEPGRRRRSRLWLMVLGTLLLMAILAVVLLSHEAHTSRWQAWALQRYAAPLGFEVAPGPSEHIRFPKHGPFDERLGYTRIPAFLTSLQARGFEVTEQARHNPALIAHLDRGLYAPYAEKAQAGLTVFDCRHNSIHRFRYPHRQFEQLDNVPPVVAQSLLFIENRDLLDPERPNLNPAVDWVRFTRAVLGQLGNRLHAEVDTPGGSTLATQIEKYRHSPAGITHNEREKLRQMVSAAVRAYQRGKDTLPVRRQILLDYLNTVPLSAAPRHGEVHGLADGLWVWFGTDLDRARFLLTPGEGVGEHQTERGQILRQVVALMVAHRRPSWYLAQGRDDLEATTDAYLRLLAAEGIIDAGWRDAALGQRLGFRDMAIDPPLLPTHLGKGSAVARSRLATWLGTSLYSLDRLDASLDTTLHGELQDAVSDYLGRLSDAGFARSQALIGERLLQPATLSEVNYSFTLLERTDEGNLVRVQTDTTAQPLDINEGSKLELGSTAKLRVLATYLELVAELHARLAPLDAESLRASAFDGQDTLTRWAVQHLSHAKDSSLDAMLHAALERRFSADPGEGFFTGGGLHTFNNFNADDNSRSPTLREAMQASINLPFVRLMREVVRHTMYQVPGSTARLLEDDSDPRREVYLARFADREGQTFLRRFWRKLEPRSATELRSMLLEGLRPTPERLTAVFRYLEPDASQEALSAFLHERLGERTPGAPRLERLYSRFAPETLDLPDRGYLAGVHPLELWLVAYRLQNPAATLSEALSASKSERQAVYGWLFRSRVKSAQDTRIYTLLEVEAFLDIHQRWTRLGYPFGHLVPSLATALGSSGDRPAALAELMGIILNDGVRLPTRHLTGVQFASDTPWATSLARGSVAGERVMAPEVARALQQALADVVERGTARRLAGSFRTEGGEDLSPGGKTGTGDNRVVVRGRAALSLNRTATFVFHLGPRYFGTVTAYVVGPNAARYRFTSGLPVQILSSMGPVLRPYLDASQAQTCASAPS
ncbi:membrane peptidoglycan carboxypeptidase [Hydrogenophaga palleronii]|uniref:peptidoglycan glycosyltransferase n=1 Tax=Hydrogenophaga palleronii TaxID=65655 RepID=A0ABU1WJX8_9BURK|nr:transglycosylase domain-containing protein [Hydrogenophaga palleronii]MDR7149267.1 membrane peptidoglycan carboxypeptidase [Hydrogenophaga palleronii]